MNDELGAQIVKQLTRWADAQESLLAIAMEARAERIKLATQMKEAMKRPFEEKTGA